MGLPCRLTPLPRSSKMRWHPAAFSASSWRSSTCWPSRVDTLAYPTSSTMLVASPAHDNLHQGGLFINRFLWDYRGQNGSFAALLSNSRQRLGFRGPVPGADLRLHSGCYRKNPHGCCQWAIVTQLRADNAELRRERDRAMSAAASLVLRLRDLEIRAGNEIRKVHRKASRTEKPYQVTGSVTRLFPHKEEAE